MGRHMQARNHDRDVATLRAFNRVYTHRLGLLNAHLDHSPSTLSDARVLYELAQRTDPTAAEIGRALDLERAQISRTLKRFADRGFVRTREDPLHARHQLLSLTAAGRKAFAALEGKTRHAVGALLQELPPGRHERLLVAARSITGVFAAESVEAVTLRDPVPGDLGWVIHRQAVLYAEEYGWNGDYEALMAGILADFRKSFDPAREAAWIAEADGCVMG